MTATVSFVEQISPNTLKKMAEGLLEYELSCGIHVDYTPYITIKMKLLAY